MRWVILVAAMVAALVAASSAHAGLTYSFGPHFGPTRPGPHSRWGYTSKSHSLPRLPADKLGDVCRFELGEYRLRHPFSKPDTLKAFHGCTLWRLDAAYHNRIDWLEETISQSENPIRTIILSVELALTSPE